MGIVEGDTRTQVFVNSVYMAADRLTLPVLPLNGVRRFPTFTAQAEVIPVRGQLVPGDTLAITVMSDRPSIVNWTDSLGKTTLYPGIVGIIAAFDDGTMTSDEWKCIGNPNDRDTLPWHSPNYNDSEWLPATEQDPSCCPWRDQEQMWRRLGARWIGPQPDNSSGADSSGPRTFFCRYHVPTDSRLPARFTALASLDAPRVSMVRFLASSSQVQVSFSVDKTAVVSCMAIDARYKLRPPIAAELKSEGVTSAVLQANGSAWKNLGPYFNSQDYDVPALSYSSVAVMEDCQALCDANPTCNGITFYEVGVHIESGGNCKLVPYFDQNKTMAPSTIHRFTHMYVVPVPIVHSLSLTGMLLPGTIYDAYCSAENPVTLEHSTWDVIAQFQHISNRTAGCLDCGATTPPEVSVRGGWAGNTELTAVMGSSKAGRIFCRAVPYPAAAFSFTPENIKAAYNANFLTQAGDSVPVQMTGLTPATEYEMACLADSDGGIESTQDNIETTRRRWFTESIAPPIIGMSIQPSVQDGLLTLTVFVQMGNKGSLWCRELQSNFTRTNGIPLAAWLRVNGVLTRVEDLVQETPGSFPGLDTNSSYEVYCAAEAANDTNAGDDDFTTPYPIATILDVNANYDVVSVRTQVDRGPSTIFCLAKLWSYTTQKEPTPPVQADMILSIYKVDVASKFGGIAVLEIVVPYIGSFYDIYCYAEEFMELPPPGAEMPPRRGMGNRAIRKTRRTVQTVGATFKNDGWLCVSGVPCSIRDERTPPRLPLRASHRILARDAPCAGRCACSGEEDANRKGSFCSPVSHDPRVAPAYRDQPDVVDQRDPRGRWCYVRSGLCHDQEPSPTFPSLWISYAVCAFNLTAGRPGSGPQGIPDEGLARAVSADGRTFSWGSSNVMALGAAYYLCWCDTLTSPCTLEVDFRLSLGRLHISGPSSRQTALTSECFAGQTCSLRRFHGHALENGSRLVALPDTSRGCMWQREYPLDPPGIVGFPRDGVSLEATETGSVYSWGGNPVLAAGSRYILCWCGAAVLHPGVGGGRTCPGTRPESGEGFLMPAGYLTVVGPIPRTSLLYCSLGLRCEVQAIQGVGIRGGDRTIVTSGACGEASPAQSGWATGIEELRAAGEAEGWLDGGWLRYGPDLSGCVLRSIGAPTATTCYNTTGNINEGPPVFNASMPPRGILGLPNGGISETSTTPGHYAWNAPAWAFAGDYRLCWCTGVAPSCDRPEDFKVFVGTLRLEGPAVLPRVSQFHICVRGKSCTITGFKGRMPFNSQLFIAGGECGGPMPPGAPNYGISLPSLDSTTYSWGSDRILAAPGKYRLCWCSRVGFCTRPSDFGAYSGMLQVKGLLGDNLYVYCNLGQPCTVDGIQGEGLQSGDEVRVLTVCGSGRSPSGFENNGKAVATNGGTRIVVPLTRIPGRYSLCWCPAGDPTSNVRVLCSRPEDYRLFMGMIEVGGPEPGSNYLCYEWQRCEIPALRGTTLNDGDRLLVAPAGTDCLLRGAGPIRSLLAGWNGSYPPAGHPAGRRRRFPHATPNFRNFPQGGVSSPATGGGVTYSWGSELVQTPPGTYTLCWCNHRSTPGGCTERGPFTVPAGSIRIGTYAEFAYLSRPPDPPPRSMDAWYGYGLAIPLPLIFFITIFAGWRKLSPRMARSEIEAKLFGPRQSLARIAQAKSKHMHEVKEVQGTRLRAEAQGLRFAGIGGSAMEELPDFQQPAIEDSPSRPRSRATVKSSSSANRLVMFNTQSTRRISTKSTSGGSECAKAISNGNSRVTTKESVMPPPIPTAAPATSAPDPRGGMHVWEEPDEVPLPPEPVQADFSVYQRNSVVMNLLADE